MENKKTLKQLIDEEIEAGENVLTPAETSMFSVKPNIEVYIEDSMGGGDAILYIDVVENVGILRGVDGLLYVVGVNPYGKLVEAEINEAVYNTLYHLLVEVEVQIAPRKV